MVEEIIIEAVKNGGTLVILGLFSWRMLIFIQQRYENLERLNAEISKSQIETNNEQTEVLIQVRELLKSQTESLKEHNSNLVRHHDSTTVCLERISDRLNK